MNNTTILEIVREGFEEQKGVKILSLFFEDEKTIRGIYIIPPEQSLSFLQLPLLDMTTDLDGYTIFLEELGQLLTYSYRLGSIFHFDWLLHKSEINCVSNYFDTLINTCKNNPPLLLFKQKFIEWVELTDEVLPIRTQTFLKYCQIYNSLDSLEYDEDLDVDNSASVSNHFQYVKQQLKEKRYKKINELTMNEIDKLFIQMQIDLYTTDNR